MTRVLKQKFFDRPTVTIARELLGAYLVRQYKGKTIAGMITDVEVYDGFHDRASHASRGKTKRNAPMFGPAGYWYVYFTYGMHWMLNIVTREEGYPAAILIRGVESASRRIPGPARVTKYFKIDKQFNGKPANRRTGLWIEDRGVRIKKLQIKKSPRIGVDYAGPIWSKKHYRFSLAPEKKLRV